MSQPAPSPAGVCAGSAVGYSGWGADQLDNEISNNSWLVSPANKRSVMGTDPKDLWAGTLRGMGPKYAPLANFPEDPSLN